jgi:hypothetical protein
MHPVERPSGRGLKYWDRYSFPWSSCRPGSSKRSHQNLCPANVGYIAIMLSRSSIQRQACRTVNGQYYTKGMGNIRRASPSQIESQLDRPPVDRKQPQQIVPLLSQASLFRREYFDHAPASGILSPIQAISVISMLMALHTAGSTPEPS